MKTAKWLASALALALAASGARATLSGALEGDARGSYSARDGRNVELNSVGGSLRKVFADDLGDRVTLYAQGELADDLSDPMLHQAYAEWKGPMGRWNVAAGRVPLPWGLLTSWNPDRMPYSSPYDWTSNLESDNGALLRGTLDIWDYGVALTQGYGMQDPEEFPGPGNLTGRVSVTPDEAGDVTMGLSFATGTVYPDSHGSSMGHMMMDDDEREQRTALALDCTWNAGRGTYRVEGGTRRTDGQWHGTLFAAADYALLPKVTLQAAGQVYEHSGDHFWRRLYGGLAVPLAWFTIRGGYEYEQAEVEDHRVVLQVYRLFRFIR